MSHRGTSLVSVNPYGVGLGPHARIRMSLKGLGLDSTDYGIEARQAALSRDRRERMQRVYEQQDALRREAEREKTLKIAQEAVTKARGAQADILMAGQNQFRRLLFAGSGIAIMALGAITVASVVGGKRRKGFHVSKRSKRKSRKAWSRKATWKRPSYQAPEPAIGVVS